MGQRSCRSRSAAVMRDMKRKLAASRAANGHERGSCDRKLQDRWQTDSSLCVWMADSLMASMGEAVGEKITRAVERATKVEAYL